jgi:hypothetical protein
LKIQPAFEEDDRYRDVDHRHQTITERPRVDPSQSVRSKPGPRQQQEHDARDSQVSRNRLGEYADRQSEH